MTITIAQKQVAGLAKIVCEKKLFRETMGNVQTSADVLLVLADPLMSSICQPYTSEGKGAVHMYNVLVCQTKAAFIYMCEGSAQIYKV